MSSRKLGIEGREAGSAELECRKVGSAIEQAHAAAEIGSAAASSVCVMSSLRAVKRPLPGSKKESEREFLLWHPLDGTWKLAHKRSIRPEGGIKGQKLPALHAPCIGVPQFAVPKLGFLW
eukprot:1109630-Pelagomonas_calceolata.AAC.6